MLQDEGAEADDIGSAAEAEIPRRCLDSAADTLQQVLVVSTRVIGESARRCVTRAASAYPEVLLPALRCIDLK